MALTHAIHKEHSLGQSLVQKHVLHPEVQGKEEANFVLGWKLTHVSGPKGGHALETQGAGTGLLPVGVGEACSTDTATMTGPENPGPGPSPTSISITAAFLLVAGVGGIRDYAGAGAGDIQSSSVH